MASHVSSALADSGSYESVARIYDLLAECYSVGAIRRCKEVHLPLLRPGQRVLYAGSGSASEALGALGRGAHVTLIDTSAEMLQRARRRLARVSHDLRGRLETHQGSAFDFGGEGTFDHVVSPFFLNVFGEADVGVRLDQLTRFLKPGGQLTIADFRAAAPGALGLLQRAYYQAPLWLFHWLTETPLHPIYDYRQLRHHSRRRLTETSSVTIRTMGLPLFESVTFDVA